MTLGHDCLGESYFMSKFMSKVVHVHRVGFITMGRAFAKKKSMFDKEMMFFLKKKFHGLSMLLEKNGYAHAAQEKNGFACATCENMDLHVLLERKPGFKILPILIDVDFVSTLRSGFWC